MAGNPSISLHVRGGDKGTMDPGYMPSANALNPMGQVSDILGVVQKMNEVKQFNNAFSARQKAGRILADSPNLETAAKTMAQDPDISVFAPEAVTNAMNTNTALLNYSGEVGKQGQDAFVNFIKGFPAVLQDPKQYETLVKTSLDLASPAIKDKLATSFGHLKDGLLDGLDADPNKAKGQLVQRISGYMAAANAGGAIPTILGAPGQIDLGKGVQPVTIAPAQGGPNWLGGGAPGSVTRVGNQLMKGLPPGVYSPEGVVAGGENGNGGAGAPAQPGATAPAQSIEVPKSMAGEPLVPEGYKIPKSTSPTDISGNASSTNARSLLKDYTTKDLDVYRGAQNSLGALQEMDASLDHLAKDGGFLTPGAAGETRLKIANAVNTVAQIAGAKVPFDPEKVAKGEDFLKATQRMGPSVLQSLLGQQREAAETIKNMNEKGVPGIDNSYLGGKLMTSTLRQAVNRQIDLYNFKGWYAAHNHQDLTGAEGEFNRMYPATSYVDRALAEYGMDKNGFTSPQAVIDAMTKGYLTREQSVGILKKEFPSGPEQK